MSSPPSATPPSSCPPAWAYPQRAGWAWFYLYNEHFARFLGKRIPHDYGQTPVWLFWLYAAIWIMPWTTFLPGAIATIREQLGHRIEVTIRQREAALTVTLWALIVLVFFTLSSRQEYYQLPALPALALMAGGQLARNTRSNLTWHSRFLVPLASLVAVICSLLRPHSPPTGPPRRSLHRPHPERGELQSFAWPPL